MYVRVLLELAALQQPVRRIIQQNAQVVTLDII